jgi:hypothetical protein
MGLGQIVPKWLTAWLFLSLNVLHLNKSRRIALWVKKNPFNFGDKNIRTQLLFFPSGYTTMLFYLIFLRGTARLALQRQSPYIAIF